MNTSPMQPSPETERQWKIRIKKYEDERRHIALLSMILRKRGVRMAHITKEDDGAFRVVLFSEEDQKHVPARFMNCLVRIEI